MGMQMKNCCFMDHRLSRQRGNLCLLWLTPVQAIVNNGFDERHAYFGGMFGAGIYFAEDSSKSNQVKQYLPKLCND